MVWQVMQTPVHGMWVPLVGLQESQTRAENSHHETPYDLQDVSGAAVHHLVLFKNLTDYYLKVRSGTNQLHQGGHI